jgi:integrase
MPRTATGQVIERNGKRGVSYALRFRAYGERRFVTLAPGTSRREAELELENVLADVRRGIWRAPTAAPVAAPTEAPTFHEFASEWLAAREAEGLAPKTLVDLRWSLSNHLLPFFAGHKLRDITVREVDRYKTAKTRERAAIEAERAAAVAIGERYAERGLSNGSINHTLRHLSQILETATEYELIDSNPASGKRRRLKAARPSRPWVEPEQLPALLAASKVDGRTGVGRVLLGILAGAGLRIDEALSLHWRHVDLATGTLRIVKAKTDAGVRSVDLTPALREELTLWKDSTPHAGPDDYVLSTSTGRKHNPSNLRRDVLARAMERANVELAKDGLPQIEKATFHGLRRTFASLRCACGDDVRYVADQLGHTDVRFSLTVYANATKRRDRLTGAHAKAYDEALEWAHMGTNAPLTVPEAVEHSAA